MTGEHKLDAAQKVTLQEACRMKDRLDKLDRLIRGDDDYWIRMREDRNGDITVYVDGLMAESRQQATVLKQLLVSLRLPDPSTGKRPQQRGTNRGAYKKGSGNVSSLDAARARAAKG